MMNIYHCVACHKSGESELKLERCPNCHKSGWIQYYSKVNTNRKKDLNSSNSLKSYDSENERRSKKRLSMEQQLIIRENSQEVADTIAFIDKMNLNSGQSRKLCHFVYKNYADKAQSERGEKSQTDKTKKSKSK